MAEVALCNIEDCCNPAGKSRGMCNAHYLRFLRRGNPTSGRTMNGEKAAYLLAHMWDDCPKWPYKRMSNGYAQIHWKSAKTRSQLVHRVVCELVNGPPPTDKSEAAHACGKGHEGCFGARCLSWKDRTGNAADMVAHGNSAWGERSYFARLTKAQVVEILASLHEPNSSLARRYGVTTDSIQNIRTGKTWRHLPRPT